MPAADPHPAPADLAAFAVGDLPDDRFAAVEAHLAECPECQARAAAAPNDTLAELLRAADTQPSVTADTPPTFVGTIAWGEAAAGAAAPPDLGGNPRYRLVRPLGSGGMGTVWLAEHTVMGRPVALKVIRSEFLMRPGAVERFRREVQAAAKLSHPNIVAAFDAEQAGDTHFLVMEYVEGRNLGDVVAAGPLPVAQACRYARDAARGLAHAHAHGLTHRDVKPHNLMVAADGTVKVLDFGLATIADTGTGLTGANMVVGTPDYIAPEQAEDARSADARSDVYALGCTLYHLLTGRVPFPADTVMKKLYAHREQTPEPIADVPEELGVLVGRMMAKNPADRPQSAAEVADALDGFVGARSVSEGVSKPRAHAPASDRRFLWVPVVAGLLLVVWGVVYKIQRDNEEITITTDDPDLEVVMKRKGELVRIRDAKTGQMWELDTVKHQIGLADQPDGLRLDLPGKEPFVLRRAGKAAFTITREPRSPAPDQELVQGTWKLVSLETLGPVAPVVGPKELPVPTQFVFKGNRLGAVYSPDRTLESTFRFVPGTNPRQIEVTGSLFQGMPDLHGVFKLDGDTFTACLVAAHEERPTDFTINGPRNRLLIVARRATTPEKSEPPAHVRKFGRPSEPAFHAILSPDGKAAFVGTPAGVVRYDVTTGDRAWTSGPPTEEVSAPKDGRFLLAWSADGSVRVMNPATGKIDRTFQVDTTRQSDTGRFAAAAVSPDGTRAVASYGAVDEPGKPRVIRVWDVAKGKELFQLTGHRHLTFGVAYSPDGSRIATASYDGTIRLWEADTGKPVHAFTGHDGAVSKVAFTPDGKTLVTCGEDTTVREWDITTKKEVAKYPGHHTFASAVAVTPDATRVVSAGWGKGNAGDGLRVWDRATGKQLHHYDDVRGILYTIAVTPDSTTAVTAGHDGFVRVWRLPAPSPPAIAPDPRPVELPEKVGLIRAIPLATARFDLGDPLSPNGRLVLCPAGAKPDLPDRLRVVEVATGRVIREIGQDGKWLAGMMVMPDGRRVLMCVQHPSAGYGFRVWDIVTGEETTLDRLVPTQDRPVLFHASADGKRLAMTLRNPDGVTRSRVVNLETGAELLSIPAPKEKAEWLMRTRLSADGKQAVTATTWRSKTRLGEWSRLRVDDLDGRAKPREVPLAYYANDPFFVDGSGNIGAFVLEQHGRFHAEHRDADGKQTLWQYLGDWKSRAVFPEATGRRVAVLMGDDKFEVFDARTGWGRFDTEPLPKYKTCSVSQDGRVLAVQTETELRLYRLPDPKQ